MLVTLHCSFVANDLAAGDALPAGTYLLALSRFEGDSFASVIFEDLSVTVSPLVLQYEGEDTAQYEYEVYEYTHSVTWEEVTYTFDLVATMMNEDGDYAEVGSEVPYDEPLVVSKEDASVMLSCEGARVSVVKRSTDVAIEATGDFSAVYYGDSVTPCRAKFKGLPLTAEEGVTIRYSWRRADDTAYIPNALPTAINSYVIKAELVSDRYEAAAFEFLMTIVRRPVLVRYKVTDASKTYGIAYSYTTQNTFSSQNVGVVRLESIFTYDEATGTALRDKDYYSSATDVRSTVSGCGISSPGMAADAAVGSYAFEYNLIAVNYDIKAVELYLFSNGNTVTSFTVVQAPRPAKPTLTLETSGRAIMASSDGSSAIEAEISTESDFSSSVERVSSDTSTARFANRLYGVKYYVRIRTTDDVNYVTAESEWSDVKNIAVSFLAPEVRSQSVTDTDAVFTASELQNAGEYVIEHRVGTSGSWKEGLTVTGLTPNAKNTVYFRAKSSAATGAETSVEVVTLPAAVKESEIEWTYDRIKGVLSVESELSIEIRLVTRDGEVVYDWTEESAFEEVERDGEYLLQIRNVTKDGVSAITSIEIDTYKAKEPFTFVGFISDWFLVIVAAVVIIAFVIVTIFFAKLKKKIDRSLKRKKKIDRSAKGGKK